MGGPVGGSSKREGIYIYIYIFFFFFHFVVQQKQHSIIKQLSSNLRKSRGGHLKMFAYPNPNGFSLLIFSLLIFSP